MIAALVLLVTRLAPPDQFRFVAYGDCRDGHTMHRKLVGMIMQQKPAFVIQTGDLVANGGKEAQWKRYDDIVGPMAKSVPLYPAPGNHDFGDFYPARVTAPVESGTKQYYSFTRGPWHFISLAVDEHMAYKKDSDQYTWLVGDLKKAKVAKRQIAVFFHVPPYSIGTHGSDLDVRATLCPLFRQYGVSLVLNGHDHLYYRTIREGITYIVTGGGGAPIYPAIENNGEIPGDRWVADNHIVVIDANGTHLKAKAMRPDGSVFDTFEVTGRNK